MWIDLVLLQKSIATLKTRKKKCRNLIWKSFYTKLSLQPCRIIHEFDRTIWTNRSSYFIDFWWYRNNELLNEMDFPWALSNRLKSSSWWVTTRYIIANKMCSVVRTEAERVFWKQIISHLASSFFNNSIFSPHSTSPLVEKKTPAKSNKQKKTDFPFINPLRKQNM